MSATAVPISITLSGYTLDMECSIALSYVASLRGEDTDAPGTNPDLSEMGAEVTKKQEVKCNLYPPKIVEQTVKVHIPAAVGAPTKRDGEVLDARRKAGMEIRLAFWFKNGSSGKDGKGKMGNQVWVRYAMGFGERGESNEESCKGEVMLLRYF